MNLMNRGRIYVIKGGNYVIIGVFCYGLKLGKY